VISSNRFKILFNCFINQYKISNPLCFVYYREAIALAKVRLSPLDPALEELYTLWAQQLTKDGNYEQAAKW